MFPILNPPPTSLPIPSLWVVPVHQPQASSIVYRTWTGDSFHISHPLPLPQSPKDCSIYQCLFCCLVCVSILYWCFSFWLTSLCIKGSSFIHLIRTEHFLTPYTKINSKWIKDLKVRPETIKLLEENIAKTLSDINHSRILHDPPPRILEIKAKINK